MTTWMKKANNFQIEKVPPQGVAQALLDFFCQFQLGVADKSAAYIKKSMCRISENLENTKNYDSLIFQVNRSYLQYFSKPPMGVCHNSQSIDQDY